MRERTGLNTTTSTMRAATARRRWIIFLVFTRLFCIFYLTLFRKSIEKEPHEKKSRSRQGVFSHNPIRAYNQKRDSKVSAHFSLPTTTRAITTIEEPDRIRQEPSCWISTICSGSTHWGLCPSRFDKHHRVQRRRAMPRAKRTRKSARRGRARR